MGKATLDGENLSEEVILRMSFELQERTNLIMIRRKSNTNRGNTRTKSLKKENLASSWNRKKSSVVGP